MSHECTNDLVTSIRLSASSENTSYLQLVTQWLVTTDYTAHFQYRAFQHPGETSLELSAEYREVPNIDVRIQNVQRVLLQEKDGTVNRRDIS